MVQIPTETFALTQKQDGYSGTSEGLAFESMDPYLEGKTIALPSLADGQVLIKVAMASINPSDLHYIKGEYGHPRVKGAAAGFEGVGDVIAGAGNHAQSLIGKRVAFTVGPDGSGAWAEYAVTSAAVCIPVRDDMRNEDAAGHVVNPLTAMAMFDIVRNAKSGSFIMTAANSQLCQLMTALGRDNDISADIFASMPNQARWVVYGKLDPQPPKLQEMGQFIFMQKQIEGFWLTRWFMATPRDEQVRIIGEVQARFVSGQWQTEVSDTIRLKDAMNDLAEALRNTTGKVMLIP